MPSTSLNVGYRPMRIGLLVRPNEIEDVIRAAELNACVWGGRFNPMIVASDDTELAVETVRRFRVDLLHEIVKTEGSARVVSRCPDLEMPPLGRAPFEPGAEGGLGAFDVRRIINDLHARGAASRQVGFSAVRATWDPGDRLAPTYSLLFGDYGKGPLAERFRDAFDRGLAAEIFDLARIGDTDPRGRTTPWSLTGLELDPDRYLTRQLGHGVVVGDPERADDLRRFWNLRSVGVSVAFWPAVAPGPLEVLSRSHLDRLAQRRLELSHPSPLTVWLGNGCGEVPADVAQELDDIDSHYLVQSQQESNDEFVASDAPIWRTRSESVLGSFEEGDQGHARLTFPLPSAPFSASRRRGFEDFETRWIVTVDSYSDWEYPHHTFWTPPLPKLTRWAGRTFTPVDGVRILDDGLALFSRVSETHSQINLVEKPEVVRSVLRSAGIEASPSPAGEAAERIIRQLNGLNGCRPLRLPGLRKLLWRAEHSATLQEAVRAIEDGGTFRLYRNVATAKVTFERLLSRGVFQAGLHVLCKACRVVSRHAPETLGQQLTCPRCGTAFPLAPNLPNAEWRYMPSGFFATGRSHGAIPVILTMMRLHPELHPQHCLVAASHNLSWEGYTSEIDVVAVHHDPSDEPVEIAVGECKGGKQQIGAAEVARLQEVAERLDTLGTRQFIVFSTTREVFSHDELRLFRHLNEIRGGVIVLTLRELGRYEPYPYSSEPQLMRRYRTHLQRLAAYSSQRYFADAAPPNDNITDGLLI